jgi:hypothetical protein
MDEISCVKTLNIGDRQVKYRVVVRLHPGGLQEAFYQYILPEGLTPYEVEKALIENVIGEKLYYGKGDSGIKQTFAKYPNFPVAVGFRKTKDECRLSRQRKNSNPWIHGYLRKNLLN